ncbi:MAG: metal-sulfur cluster assembly factor [Candidatus Rokubacteria bacterium]|nr:metal-sulfur cluster assembly factor [Candidatus Rokubacteria bacterium]
MSLSDRAPFIAISETTRASALPRGPVAEDPGCVGVPGGSDQRPRVTPEQVRQALRTVFDPELGMSVVELGLVYDIEICEGGVRITMTLTTPGCPIHDVMPGWVRGAVMAIPGVEQVEVELTFDPPWTPDRISLSRPH